MKILAIRGCNLASLAGEFEIDLARGALGGAGVFAIVGNTGAGKSTLLDALCVALFDRTPRLTNHSRVVVGRSAEDPAALGAQDVRTLLRRGSAQGWAEVDFESGDARRYRARWSVRRARGHVDGTLQAQQVTLTTIDGGERLGGTKTETLEAIQARLGLSFEQFRRSALLAQGEFAAFLRAEGKDRSELLERMTGTEIYSRLSVAAHLRATLAEQRLAAGRTAALAIAVLDDEARRAAELELARAEDAKSAARARFAGAQDAARWATEAARRADAVHAAEAEVRAAESALAGADGICTELALRRRAEALRGPWDDVARAERHASIAAGELVTARDAASTAEHTTHALDEQRRSLDELVAPLRTARIAAGLVERSPRTSATATASSSGSVSGAGSVSGSVSGSGSVPGSASASGSGSGSRSVSTSGAGLGARTGRASSVNPVLTASSRDVMRDEIVLAEQHARAALEDAAWLEARAGLAGEVAGWGELDAKFAAHAAAREAIAGFERALADQSASMARLAKAQADATTERQAATAKLGEAQRKADAFQKRRGLSLDAARRQEDQARTRVVDVERLGAIAKDAAAARTSQLACAERERVLDAEAATDRDARVEADVALSTARMLRTERTRALDELRRAAGYEHARTELVDGEPCPLCGASEHPWRDRGAFDELIAAAAARLAEVGDAFDDATATLAALDARATTRETERARLATQRAAAEDAIARATAVWAQQLTSLGELSLVRDPAGADAERLAAELRAAATKRLEEARTLRSATEASLKAAAEAQADVQLSQANLDALATKLADLERRRAELASAVERIEGQRAERADRLAELATQLASAVATWVHLAGDELPARLAAQLGAASSSRTARVDASHPSGRSATATTETGEASRFARVAPISAVDPGTAERRAHGAAGNGVEAERRAHGAAGNGVEAGRRAHGAADNGAERITHFAAADAPELEADAAASNGTWLRAAGVAETVRRWIAELAASWRMRADRVANAEAEVNGVLTLLAVALRTADAARVEHAARRDELERRHGELVATQASARIAFDAACTDAGFAVDELRALLVDAGESGATRIERLADQLASFERAVERTRAIAAERRALAAAHVGARPASIEVRANANATQPSAAHASANAMQPNAAHVGAQMNATAPEAAHVGAQMNATAPRAAHVDASATGPNAAHVGASAAGPNAGHANATGPNVAHVGAPDADATLRFVDGDEEGERGTADLAVLGGVIAKRVEQLGAMVAMAEEEVARRAAQLAADTDARGRRAAAMAQLEAAEGEAQIDRVLGEVIGSHDGKRFRAFAQSLTLDGLLALANSHLDELAPRYQLERVPGHDLELQVIDRELGDEVRSVQSLSGGESFLASLALALGLSSMSAHDVRVRTLLIDEGFGTLDPATLDTALSVLDALQARGRQVGVISHVPQLVERVGACVRVVQRGGGRSEVIVA